MNKNRLKNELLLGLFQNLILAISYAALGRFALLLAIPPGYATAIFPSAGIAVAALLIWGNRLWLGVFAGSVLLNVWISLDQGNLSLAGFGVAVGAGIGASLQALAGAWLVRRTIGFPTTLDQERNIFLFMLLAGPVACLINASFGVTSLYVSGLISEIDIAYSWFTWWVGDVFGVLIAAPFMFIAFAKPRELWLARRNSVAIPLCVMLTAVIFLFIWVSKWELEREKSGFNEIAKDTVGELRVSFNNYIEAVISIERFYVSSLNVTRDNFHSFVEMLLERKPGIQGLSWNPIIKNHEREHFEKTTHKEGFSNFQITERNSKGKIIRAKNRSEYVAVNYIEPIEKNISAHGFDVASNDARRKALHMARDSGKAVATARITLVQEKGKQAGFLLFHPVYKGPQNTVAERRKNLKGYAVGVFRIGDIVDAVLPRQNKKNIVVSILDESTSAIEQLYGKNNKQAGKARFEWQESLEIGGRQWSVTIRPSKKYLATNSDWKAWSILAAGCLFISLLAAFLLAMTGRSYQVERLVDHRTAELSGILSTAIETIITTDEKGLIESINPAGEALFNYRYDELFKKSISKIIPEFFMYSEDASQNNALAGNRCDSYGIKKDSSTVEIELAISTLSIFDKIRYTIIVHDLTERTKVNRMKDDFISTVSHELRTPLTSIKGSIGLIIGGALGEDADKKDKMLAVSYQNIEHLELLINDLLDFNKTQSSENHFKREEIHLNSLIEKAILSNQGYADKYKVSFKWVSSQEHDLYINGDKNKLMQVLFNLFSNAIKYSPKESQVAITTSINGSIVRVSISDSGQGIPLEFQDRVFDRFTQADSSSTRRVGGTGLGMAITKSIIEKHDGHIGFNSKPGQGTTFYFELPILKEMTN